MLLRAKDMLPVNAYPFLAQVDRLKAKD
jgi:hypothetical protein